MSDKRTTAAQQQSQQAQQAQGQQGMLSNNYANILLTVLSALPHIVPAVERAITTNWGKDHFNQVREGVNQLSDLLDSIQDEMQKKS